jgi:phenylacetate-CoA ligase
MMIVRGVNVFPTQIEEKLLAIPALSVHYQLVLTRDGRMDNMEIQVEALPDASHPAREAATAELTKSVKDTIGISAAVTVLDPGTIERSVGKAKRVIDRRPKE